MQLPLNLKIIDLSKHKGSCLPGIMGRCLKIRKIIKEENIDILYDSFASLWPLYILKNSLNIKVFTSLYCLNAWRLRNVWKDLKLSNVLSDSNARMMFYGRWIESFISKNADSIILQAPGLIPRFKEDYEISDEKLKYLTNSVDTAFWQRKEKYKSTDKSDRINLVFFGAASFSRGLFCLLDVLKNFTEKKSNVMLSFVGPIDNNDKDKMNRFLLDNNLMSNVILHGKCSPSEVIDKLSGLDLFIYQTINDGSPRTVLEAMSLGVPMIVSNHPGIEILDPEKEYLHFTDFADIDHIVELIAEFTDNKELWFKKAEKAAKYAADNFSCSKAAEKYAELLSGENNAD
jgi:glycosyltransferase involved in cell wall biosynthesis